MADEIDGADHQDDDGDVLDLKADDQIGDQQDDDSNGSDDDDQQQDDGDELVISIGDEAAPASEGDAPGWVRDLRKQNRELQRRLAEAEKASPAEVPEVGDKPTLAGCEYDEERFEQEHDAWKERKAKAESARTEAEQAQVQAQERWQAELTSYGTQKDSLGAKDFGTVEEEVTATLSTAQQAILIQGAENKALLVYALGKNPEKLRQLASITDPIKFAFAAAKLEGKTKMERRPATSPEGRVSGGAPRAGGTDKTLERLEKEADKTGDRTKLIDYRRQLRDRAKK